MARDSDENAESTSQVRPVDVNPSSSGGTLVAKTTKNSVNTRLSHHKMTIFPNNVGHLEKVYSNVRRKLGRQPNDDIEFLCPRQ